MSEIRPIVITGPSGTGKSTLFNRAMKEYPNSFAFSVSHTTRKPREGEDDGVHYHFVDRETMLEMIANGEFIEYAEFGKNLYGTSRKAIEDIQASRKICILDLELQGVRNIHALNYAAKCILIRAPSLDVLEQRLRDRGTETVETIRQRLKHAQDDEVAALKEPHLFDKVIVNDVLDDAYQEFLEAITEELEAFHKSHSNGTTNGQTSTFK